jgi:hypothetical protein
MFGTFKFTRNIVGWLVLVVLVCSVTSYNMPEHPTPNETVILPGYQFIEYAIYTIGISIILSVFRTRSVVIRDEANWLEAFTALTGAALFISPFVALFVKFVFLLFN